MMTSCLKEEECSRTLPRFGLHRSFLLRRKCCVAFAADDEAVTKTLLVGEGSADAPVLLLAVALDGVEDVEGRYLFFFGRFGLCCHGLSPFSCFNKSPKG